MCCYSSHAELHGIHATAEPDNPVRCRCLGLPDGDGLGCRCCQRADGEDGLCTRCREGCQVYGVERPKYNRNPIEFEQVPVAVLAFPQAVGERV